MYAPDGTNTEEIESDPDKVEEEEHLFKVHRKTLQKRDKILAKA